MTTPDWNGFVNDYSGTAANRCLIIANPAAAVERHRRVRATGAARTRLTCHDRFTIRRRV